MERKEDRVSLYIINEKTIENIFTNELNIEETIKSNLSNLIKSCFVNFCDLFYNILKYYYIPSSKKNENINNKKDLYKIHVINKFVNIEDIFVIDIYDYLYTITNIDRDVFSFYFYDYLGNKMTELNIDYEEAYNYFYYIENLFNMFILDTIFNKKLFEVEENIVLGINYFNWQELRVFVYEN